MTDACPCGRPLPYAQCCGALHDEYDRSGHLTAPDAEALMRSRYSAFVMDRRDYLMATWHPRTRPRQLEAPEPGLRWLGLDVLRHRVLDEDHAEVRFVARSKLGGRAHRLTETSRFERINGEWLYVDGDIT